MRYDYAMRPLYLHTLSIIADLRRLGKCKSSGVVNVNKAHKIKKWLTLHHLTGPCCESLGYAFHVPSYCI